MAVTYTAQKQDVLDTLHRVQKLAVPAIGVYVGLSHLAPMYRNHHQIELILQLFDPLLQNNQSRLFTLPNKDIVVIGIDITIQAIEDVLFQIRSLFDEGTDLPEQIFFLDKDADKFARLFHSPAPTAPPVNATLTPETLDQIALQLPTLDVTDFLRRRSVFVAKNRSFLYQEIYLSVTALGAHFGYDLSSDNALFFQLMQMLDEPYLKALARICFYQSTAPIAVRLSLATVNSAAFTAFAKKWPTPLLVHLSAPDIFQDIMLYKKALYQLHISGHKVIIGDLSPVDLEHIHIHHLPFDFIKVRWSPACEQLTDLPTHLILSHCETEDALLWGVRKGCFAFQGPYIDALLGALIKESCTFGQECSLAACTACRKSLAPQTRNQCVHQKHLDDTPSLKELLG